MSYFLLLDHVGFPLGTITQYSGLITGYFQNACRCPTSNVSNPKHAIYQGPIYIG